MSVSIDCEGYNSDTGFSNKENIDIKKILKNYKEVIESAEEFLRGVEENRYSKEYSYENLENYMRLRNLLKSKENKIPEEELKNEEIYKEIKSLSEKLDLTLLKIKENFELPEYIIYYS